MNELPVEMKSLFAEYAYFHEQGDCGNAFDKLYQIYSNFQYQIEPDLACHMEKMLINETLSGIMEYQETSEEPGISDEWLHRSEKIPKPQEHQKGSFFDYSIILYQTAWRYLADGNYEKAKLYYLKAEAYFEKCDSSELNNYEIRKWITQFRKMMKKRIHEEPVDIGSHITNQGWIQQWIGVVVKRDDKKNMVTVRMTFSNSSSFRVGKDYSLLNNEVKILKGVSLRAAIHMMLPWA